MKKKLASLLLFTQLVTGSVHAQQAFVVRQIEIEGLHNISSSTVMNYLPIKRGQTLQPSKTGDILRSLYQTGFFDRISLSRQGNTLIIHVVERPTIGQLKISGNSIIPTDKLTSVMKTLDVAEGRVYNPVVLERIKQSLLNQYYQVGRYNARVDVVATPMSRNRIAVRIDISEGLTAKIRGISIIGNKVFDESTLIKQLDISSTGLFSFVTQDNNYSEEKLETSLDKLRSYYMDHGYLRFDIKSSQAAVSPDRKSVYVTIVVSEGDVYKIKRYDVTGNLILPRAEIEKFIDIQPGDTFSRQKVMDAQKNITKRLGEKGYMFSTVAVHPQVDDKTHEVVLVFEVKPGKRAYIHNITFSDNTRTNDIALRREIQQMEAAPVSTTKLEDSKQRLSLLPYIKDVSMSVKPVPGTDDQVDVDYQVKEDSSAQATAKLGYSQSYGLLLGAGFNQKNFFGTGNTLGVNFTRSKVEQFAGIDYTNPYYTPDGISRTFSLSVSRVDPGATSNVNSDYTTNEYDFGVMYAIPIGQEEGAINRIIAGATYQNTLIHLNAKQNAISAQVLDFITRHGRRFQEMDLRLGYSRDSRDKAIFPTRGNFQTTFADVFAPLDSRSVAFYSLNYHGRFYQPLYKDFILLTRADLGYGNGFRGIHSYPFFRNFFAGGIDSVRGYEAFTLGPNDSNGKAFGGNMLVDASIGLIFPNYISDNLRTSVFLDGGNVYTSLNNRGYGGKSTNSGPIRYSAGLEADLLTPFGPVALSFASPLNKRHGDSQQIFQLSLGANF